MTEPSSGVPRPLPAEPDEPIEPDPAMAPEEELDAELDEEAGGDEADADETDADEADFDEEGEFEEETREGEPAATEGPIPGAVVRPTGPGPRRRGVVAPAPSRLPTQSELAVRVTDNQSRFFVIATVVIFVGILAFGLLAGTGGVLSPHPTPTPVPTATVAPSAAPSASAEPSSSTGASESPSASASPSAAASASPS